MLVPEKDVLKEMANAAYERAKELDRGDVIPWEAIEEAAGIERYSEHWTSVIKKLKRKFLDERGIALWAVAGVGLKLTTKDEQLNLITVKRQRRAVRQMSRSLQELGALPSLELTNNQRRLQAYRLDEMHRTRRLMKRSIRHQGEEVRKTEVNPRRPLPAGVS